MLFFLKQEGSLSLVGSSALEYGWTIMASGTKTGIEIIVWCSLIKVYSWNKCYDILRLFMLC